MRADQGEGTEPARRAHSGDAVVAGAGVALAPVRESAGTGGREGAVDKTEADVVRVTAEEGGTRLRGRGRAGAGATDGHVERGLGRVGLEVAVERERGIPHPAGPAGERPHPGNDRRGERRTTEGRPL